LCAIGAISRSLDNVLIHLNDSSKIYYGKYVRGVDIDTRPINEINRYVKHFFSNVLENIIILFHC
jgi:hypothetical protein